MRLLLTFLCGMLAAGCYECNQDNCANGCCNRDGVCIVNATTDKECGTGGLACDDCTVPAGFSCVSGTCAPRTCNPTNCAGCCQGFQCVFATNQSTNACGGGAQACMRCGTRQLCANGRCCGDVGAACSGSYDCCGGRTCRDINGTKTCQ
jgi:hypothetical protein